MRELKIPVKPSGNMKDVCQKINFSVTHLHLNCILLYGHRQVVQINLECLHKDISTNTVTVPCYNHGMTMQTTRIQLYKLNSPMVEIKVELKASSENLTRMQVLPTPLSPINSSLNK